MDEIGIEIVRDYQDEPQDSYLFANNGVFQGGIELDINEGCLEKIGKALSQFPREVPDEYSYELSSHRSKKKGANFVLLAYTTDNLGHTAVQITMDRKMDMPDEGECRFSIMSEPWAIHRLGDLILEFSKSKYRALKWSLSPDNDALVEWEHPLPVPEEKKSFWEAFREPPSDESISGSDYR